MEVWMKLLNKILGLGEPLTANQLNQEFSPQFKDNPFLNQMQQMQLELNSLRMQMENQKANLLQQQMQQQMAWGLNTYQNQPNRENLLDLLKEIVPNQTPLQLPQQPMSTSTGVQWDRYQKLTTKSLPSQAVMTTLPENQKPKSYTKPRTFHIKPLHQLVLDESLFGKDSNPPTTSQQEQ
jgi:hypothetical protein